MAELLQKVQAAVGLGVVPPAVGSKLETGVLLKEQSVMEANVSLDNLKGRNVIVGVPGAFTPTCSSQIPGYIQDIEKFKAKGIDTVYVVTINDAFITAAWKEKLGATGQSVRFLADDTGKFTAAIGMGFDGSRIFGNTRSHRYAMIVEDGVIKALEQEKDDSKITTTGSTELLAKL